VQPEPAPCRPYFEDVVQTSAGEVKVYRCEWGWFVKNGDREARSRFLDEAFEQALGKAPDQAALRGMVDMLTRELTAERDEKGATASRTLRP
jgi:hypothetical protein